MTHTGRTLALALTLSAALPFTAATADAPGIDLAGIDRSVAPGDDFFAYANGAWFKATEIPADRATYGASAIVAERTSQRTVELIQDAAKAEAARGQRRAQGRRLLRELHGRGGDRGQGARAAAAELDAIAAIADAARPAPLSRRARCAPTSTCSTRPTSTPTTCSACGSRRTWTTRAATSPFLLQGGLGMPDRDYYLDPVAADGGDRAPSTRRTSRRCSSSRQIADADGQGARASSSSSAGSPRCTRAARTRPTSRRGTTTGRGDELDKRAPGLDWAAFLVGRGPRRRSRTSSSGSRRRSRASPRSSPASRSTPGRTT